MRRLTGLVSIVVLVAVVTPASAAATPQVVIDEPGVNEGSVAVSDGYTVWSASTRARPTHSNSFVRADGEGRVRLNPLGTHSYYVTIDGTTVVYQEGTARGDDDLVFYDADSGDRPSVPEGVSTPNQEYRPSLSGDHLLFTRNNANRVRWRDAWVKVVLFDLSTETRTILEERPVRSNYVVSGQVNGDWATYETCRYRQSRGFFDCDAYRYRISTDVTEQLPNPGLQQYGAAVSDDGTAYVTRTRTQDAWECGNGTRIVRMPVGGPRTVIATLPPDRDALTTFAFDEGGGSTTLYFDRTRCENGATGIYRIPDADTAS